MALVLNATANRAGQHQLRRFETLEPRRLLASTPIISEFMARNDGGFRDADGRSPDWIEIYNPTDVSVELDGYRLTDDAANLSRWVFPKTTLEANGYLVVFASNRSEDFVDGGGNLHANFALRREGEFLALVDTTGQIVSSFGTATSPYPEQTANISFGLGSTMEGEEPKLGFMTMPTPGEANVPNSDVFTGVVADTTFSVQRGYYDQAMAVEIATLTDNASIRYTTDGTEPSVENGNVYDGPIQIATTTTLRAMAFQDDFVPTNVDTQTYIFLAHVLQQTGDGLPETWGTFPHGSSEAPVGTAVPANYEVDPEVVNDPRYANTIKDDLRSLPTLSLVTAPDGLWSEETGIYSNTLSKGIDWERPVSVELFQPDGTTEFQIDAGLRIHGGFGRRPSASAKHSFRLLFRGDYGDSKLNYPWFGESGVDEFDSIVLRANYNYSWTRGNRGGSQTGKDYTMITDRWAAETQEAMGGLSTDGTFVHLYVNGLYWGVYNPNERIDSTFLANHLGGDETEYDVVAHDGLVDGNNDAWNGLLDLVRQRPLDYEAVKAKLDVENFIDYMLLNQYGGNLDWPQNNWYASRRRVDGEQWQFHAWDSEFFFIDVDHNRVSGIPSSGPGRVFVALRRDDEFKIDFADRIQKHLFNNGALTVESNIARLNRLAEPLDRAVVGESARWGDAWMNQVEPARTRDDDWLPRLDQLRNEYFPNRQDVLLQQYRRASLFPNESAPDLNQHGGFIAAGFELVLTNPNQGGAIYYTLNGQDPRMAGGEVDSNARLHNGEPIVLSEAAQIKARVLVGENWSALTEAQFWLRGDFDRSGFINALDVDLICQEDSNPSRVGQDNKFDLNNDGTIDLEDHRTMIEGILATSYGDANLDGVFDSSDLVLIFQAGRFERPGMPAGWAAGDWNCDAEFTTADLVTAFQRGRYVAG